MCQFRLISLLLKARDRLLQVSKLKSSPNKECRYFPNQSTARKMPKRRCTVQANLTRHDPPPSLIIGTYQNTRVELAVKKSQMLTSRNDQKLSLPRLRPEELHHPHYNQNANVSSKYSNPGREDFLGQNEMTRDQEARSIP